MFWETVGSVFIIVLIYLVAAHGQDGGEPGPTGAARSSIGVSVPVPVGTVQPCEDVRHYPARVVRVVDGDTYDFDASLGFGVSIRIMVRLRDLDTPELNTPEGKRAKVAAEQALASGLVTIRPTGQQTFARWVADVYVSGAPVAAILRAGGHVKAGSR